MWKILTFLFFVSWILPASANEGTKLVIKNNAGYPIYHMSISRMDEYPDIDLLNAPLPDGQAIDVFISANAKGSLLLWLFNEDYTHVAIELGNKLQDIDYVEIQNDGSLTFYPKDEASNYLQKKKER